VKEQLLRAIKYLAPHGIVIARGRANRARRLAEARATIESTRVTKAVSYVSYESAIAFLKSRGLDEHQVREGTIPASSLEFVNRMLSTHVRGSPPVAIHVGNFVGVSLAVITSMLVVVDRGSIVIAIDPNLAHRGIVCPQSHVVAVLNEFGLQDRVVLVAGYSGMKSVSNDSTTFGRYDPLVELGAECACESVLSNLGTLIRGRVDFAIMDGNHEASYLKLEMESLQALLKPGGILALDDVTEHWAEIRDVYLGHDKAIWEDLGTDGRVGILRLN
jgi:hypothetical protein